MSSRLAAQKMPNLRMIAFFLLAFLIPFESCFQEEIRSAVITLLARRSQFTETIKYPKSISQPLRISEGWLPTRPDRIGYVRLKMDFYAMDGVGYGDLFQTAAVNEGIRVELHKEELSIVFKEFHGAYGAVLQKHLEFRKWHHMDVEASYDGNLEVSLDNAVAYKSLAEKPWFEVSDIIIGQGFDAERKFHGLCKNIEISRGKQFSDYADWFYVGLRCLTIVGLVALIFQVPSAPQKSGIAPSRQILPYTLAGVVQPLLILRGLAAIIVLFGHAVLVVFSSPQSASAMPGSTLIKAFTPCPWVGVWIFFTLSGYLMAKGYFYGRYQLETWSISDFLRNRLVRIYPVYLTVVTIVSLFRFPELFHLNSLVTGIQILTFDYQDRLKISPVGALWSISTEMQFYLMVPLLFFLFRLISSHRFTLYLVAASLVPIGIVVRFLILYRFGDNAWVHFVYTPALVNLDLFAIGFVVAAHLATSTSRSIKPLSAALSLSVLGTMLYVSSAFLGRHIMNKNLEQNFIIVGPTSTAVLSAAFILIAESARWPVTKGIVLSLPVRLLEWIGVISYCLYVVHEPIFLMIRSRIPSTLTSQTTLQFATVAIIAAVVSASVLYYGIESPIEYMRKRWRVL